MIINPSFESGIFPWGYGGTFSNIAVSTAHALDGSQSLDVSFVAQSGFNWLISQNINPVTNNALYLIQLAYLITGGDASMPCTFYIYFGGNMIVYDTLLYGGNFNIYSKQIYLTDVSSAQFVFYVYCPSAGTVQTDIYVDSVQLKVISS
jgi:hypothetical protein